MQSCRGRTQDGARQKGLYRYEQACFLMAEVIRGKKPGLVCNPVCITISWYDNAPD